MRHFRVVLVVVVLMNIALATVFAELTSMRLRYECVKKQEKVRRLALERRGWMQELAEARTPDALLSAAAGFGIHVRQARHDDIERSREDGSVVRGGSR